ncbi:MAG TPA: tetratricopeptide repeat protein, partial [Candidatus Tectomicrobia bacterium]|nr:tetratricopeptide repeat protein [Candidatus Tectomicrobia bacterium]
MRLLMSAVTCATLAALLAGCAGPIQQGRSALREGRYAEAAARFEQSLAEEPGQLEGLIGLGIARYKLGALDEAERALSSAVAQAPDVPVARLYLGLIALRRGQDAAAADQFEAFVRGAAWPRLAAHVDRTVRLLRAGPVSAEVRTYIAASIDDQVEWAREVAEERRRVREAELYWSPWGPWGWGWWGPPAVVV